jgi:hypothetical protein
MKLFPCLTAVLALACSSCGGDRIYPVRGSVTFKDTPAAGAAVFFRRQGGDRMNDALVMGVAQQDGTFEVVCGSQGKGAPAGQYDVLIEWKEATKQQGRGLPEHPRDKLRGRYADPKHPRLHATVAAQTNILAPFELTDAGPPEGR